MYGVFPLDTNTATKFSLAHSKDPALALDMSYSKYAELWMVQCWVRC